MPDHVNEELISAYIDGELAAEDRQLVERSLAESASLRQLHDQLVEIRAQLGRLPRYELPADFHERVLRRIERGEGAAAGAPAISGLPAVDIPETGSQWSRSGVVAGIIAVAAVALLAFLSGYRPTDLGPDPGDDLVNQEIESDAGAGEELDGPIDWSQESLVYYGPAKERRRHLALVVDVTLTQLGRANRAFDDVMRQAGIPLDPDLAVDEEMESTILGSRMVAKLEIEDVGLDDPRDEVEMTYVIAAEARIEDVWFRMKRRLDEFSPAPQLDITVTVQELNAFHQLNESSRRRFANAASRTKKTLAHRLAFRGPLRSTLRLLGAISTPSLENSLAPAEPGGLSIPDFELSTAPGPEALQSAQETPAQKPDQGNPGADAGPPKRMSEVLFILRYPPEN
jgi:hypothetical protein